MVAVLGCLGGYGIYYSSEKTLKYELLDNGAGYVVYCGKYFNENIVEIPNTHKGKNVIGIKANSFKDNKNLKKITIPSNVLTIGDYAFYGCTNLETVLLSDGLEDFGKYCFSNCDNLKEVVIPNTVEELDEGMFENSFKNTNCTISIPNNIISVEKNVFKNCIKLEKIYLIERLEVPVEWDIEWIESENESNKVTYSFSVNLDCDGGMLADSGEKTFVTYGENFVIPIPTKNGYSFEGWTLKDNNQVITDNMGVSTSEWSVLERKELKAKWKTLPYSITYHLDGGTNDLENIDTYNILAEDFTLKNPTKIGYDFDGWYSTADFSQRIDKIEKGTTGNINLYAKYNALFSMGTEGMLLGITKYCSDNYQNIVIPEEIDGKK